MKLRLLRACWAALLLLGVAAAAHGEGYPDRPVHLVAPFPPGSTVDILARILASRLAGVLGQSVIVDNRPGAGGAIGIEYVARAPKDGYTLLLTASGLAIIPGLNPKTPWDPVRDFAPVSEVASGPLVIVVNNNVPAHTLGELVALAKAKPESLRYGTAGVGSTQHMAGQLLNIAAGIGLVHVPYKGNVEALTDLLGGRVEVNFQSLPTAAAQIRAGKLRAIAITSSKRSPMLPAVPTVAEAGYPDATTTAWFGLLAPAGTPAAVVERLNRATVAAMNNQEVVDALAKDGSDAVTGTPQQFGKLIRDDSAMWARVIKQSGITLQ